MAKTKRAHELSLRAKFRDDDHVEVVVIDHTTCELYTSIIAFRNPGVLKATQTIGVIEPTAGEELEEESSDDKDSNSNE